MRIRLKMETDYERTVKIFKYLSTIGPRTMCIYMKILCDQARKNNNALKN